ncbi:TonB-dependent receptor [Pseudoalteromonas sp. S16_S37]|uniref:TonB-dependent receptor n=1 Tax=Pseudoalteromonas sp. S16_S37 TaxID=2720228 RepID=UPI001680AFB0|nr:TonB-dependent receptor [Pseudoalteromonas sp. S16_S37]MBD1582567.1 TonB-dependent receptor [Pseudoalteromonas sp. S16_S37]
MLNSRVSKAVRLAIAFGAASTAAFSANTFAAEGGEKVERIEVTGSSIKRTDLEGALPIDVIDASAIAKSGVTSVPDLIANLPSMQGFTAAGESVGGSGGGIQTASLRNLGSEYTLVLLNGRRMVSADSGGTIDLNSIPLSAIKRVEILKDGASALYGSDAIAGVVNFILKNDVQNTTISARYDKPKDTSSSTISITTGFGDLGSDGFNITAAYSHDQQDVLVGADRDFAKSGFINFEHAGQKFVAVAGSASAIPGNANVEYQLRDENGDLQLDPKGNVKTKTYSFNPYKMENGKCHVTSAPSGERSCQFDYSSTIEIQPETERDNFFVQGVATVNDMAEAYANASWSKFQMTTRIAPYPTSIPLTADSALAQKYVMPHLPQNVKDDMVGISASWRILPGGNRTTEYDTTTTQITAGIRGEISEWSYDVAVTRGDSESNETRVTGFPLQKEILALLNSGAIDVFKAPEDLTNEEKTSVAASMFNGLWEKTETSMTSFEAKLSGAIADLDAGSVYLGLGVDYRTSEYSVAIGEGNRNEVILYEEATPEFDLDRDNYGAFAELIVPVMENLELTGSVRYDSIGEITDSLRTGNKTVNGSENDTTYKISLSYRPTDELLLRASMGTGFKMATMRQIAAPRIEFGVTGTPYDCPLSDNHPLRSACLSDKLQYTVYREGNPELKPETSEQYTFGFVWAGDSGTSVSVDYWNIDMENEVKRLTENQIFQNPETYNHLFTTKFDQGRNRDVLAIVQAAQNVGKSTTTGIDWSIDLTNELSFGTLKTAIAGTYLIESESLRVGEDNVWDSSLGKVGPDAQVAFRNIININNSLTHGDFTHDLNVKARSGYTDEVASTHYTIYEAAETIKNKVNGDFIQLEVPVYFTVDYRMSYAYGDNANFTFGIKNLLDREPPLTLNGEAGHQVGYDPRYADPYGRTFYLQADYTF